MQNLMSKVHGAATARAAERIDALAEAAAADLPGDLRVERIADGVAIHGPGLVRRLAFDARLRGLTLGLRSGSK